MLPKNWHKDTKVIALVVEKQIRIRKRFKNSSVIWDEPLLKLRKKGLSPKEAVQEHAKKLAPHLVTKADVPKSKKWRGQDSLNDQECSCCQLLLKAGVIETAGKLRYLGTFYAGEEKVTREFWDEDGNAYYKDVSFSNYLDAWRCEVCGSENTDGY